MIISPYKSMQEIRWHFDLLVTHTFIFCRAKVTFGLNALHGKKVSSEDKSLRIGDWNAQNSRDLMEYTIAKGYQIDSYELGK